MHRVSVVLAAVLIASVAPAGLGTDGAQDHPVRQATPALWYGKFRGSPIVSEGPHTPVALTTEATPRLIVQVSRIRSGQVVADTELWVADFDGGRPELLADEHGQVMLQFEPAPGQCRVAYLVGSSGRGSDPQALREMTLRVAEPGTPPRTVAIGGVQAPGWSPDGKTLFFLKAVNGGWQPFKSEDGAAPVAASTAVFTQAGDWREPPARFSPDGRWVAGFLSNRFQAVALGSGQARDLGQTPGRAVRIAWSSDSSWLCLQTVGGTRMAQFTVDQALRVVDTKAVPLNTRLDLLAEPAQGDAIFIVAAEWLPGPGHRLLLLAQVRRGPGDLIKKTGGPNPKRETRWIVRDLDRAVSTEVVGLPTRHSPGDSSRLFIAPDGRHVLGLSEFNALDAPL